MMVGMFNVRKQLPNLSGELKVSTSPNTIVNLPPSVRPPVFISRRRLSSKPGDVLQLLVADRIA
jgi:hypothetical protein